MCIAIGLTLAALSGCGGPEAQQASDDALVEDVIVQLHVDGPPTVTQRMITRSEREAQMAAREHPSRGGSVQQAISSEPSCLRTSTWLFDDADFNIANRVCLSGAGVLEFKDLLTLARAFPRPVLRDWVGRTRAYYGGSTGGTFALIPSEASDHGCFSSFEPWRWVTPANGCATIADRISLDN
jgi:hypothetical protein